MVEMIEVQRSYEANQKSVLTADQTLGKLINEVGR
jgi:flagellar basal-body rod protein FlgF